MRSYIHWIREHVGHARIFLNFAAACITNEHGDILLQQRGDTQTWGFPGGAMELGESAEDTVRREVREETGLEIQVDELLGVYTNYMQEYPNHDQAQAVVIFFVCSVTSGQLYADQEETLDVRFFPPEQAPALCNQQHRDACADFLQHRRGVYR